MSSWLGDQKVTINHGLNGRYEKLIFLKCGPNPHNRFEERNSCPIPAQLVCAHAGVDPLPITFSGCISSTFKALEPRCSRARLKSDIRHNIFSTELGILENWNFVMHFSPDNCC